ncbi:histidine kinase [uncultured Nocardioides sp.]|uniref:sensor histidine kinase n=1 Tax=uncultured Nocardioides sp. TaxID=198441 RepID=UPI00261D1413|nr:histidine kinase [uncultured Nocardioides sp.]
MHVDDARWRRGVVGLGLAATAALLVGLAGDLDDPVVAVLAALGVGLWLVELLRTPGTPYVEGGLLLGVGVSGGLLNVVAFDSSGFLLSFFAAAALGIRFPVRLALPWLVGVLLVLDAGAAAVSPHVVSSLAANTLGVLFTFVVGAATRSAREQRARTEQLLVELEAARAGEAQAAALAERTRLARELHDILAHSLSGQVMTLEATRLLATTTEADPRIVDGLTRAHRLARGGLADARRAIGALRGDALPGPCLLPDLVDEARTTHGLRARLEVRGTPRGLPADLGLTLYRAAQEALTNTAKHAGRGARADLVLDWTDPHRLVLTATDDGTPGRASATGGYGLTGLRERAELAGGHLDAGPTDAGFVVRLELPA